ncbi:MAG: diguanylate cyclase, partial [Desulfovibrio sp.]|nr:diguanylate cyclase [Desulfovibrio sp.]
MQEKQKLQLVSGDILDMQADLINDLAQILSFSGHTLYFPMEQSLQTPQLLPRENKLLIPLIWAGRQLGVLMLRNVEVKKMRPLLGVLPGLMSIVLENLARIRAQRTDRLTNLLVKDCLYARLDAESALVRTPDILKKELAAVPAYRLCMGLIRVRLCNGEEICLQCGYGIGDNLLVRMAEKLKGLINSDVLAVRLEQYEFALLFHAPGREACRTLADTVLQELQEVTVVNPLTQKTVYPLLVAGYAFYPYDLTSNEIQLEMQEQSRILVQRAGIACDVAQYGQSLGFAHIIAQGGRIVEILPMGRLRINLGWQVGVRQGQHFAIYAEGENRIYKGELTLLQVKKKYALAELKHQEMPGLLPEIGDTLELVRDVAAEPLSNQNGEPILSQKDFYVRMQEKSSTLPSFSLVMVQISVGPGESIEACIGKVWAVWQEIFSAQKQVLFGRHGESILLFFHPNESAQTLLPHYTTLCSRLQQQTV